MGPAVREQFECPLESVVSRSYDLMGPVCIDALEVTLINSLSHSFTAQLFPSSGLICSFE